MYSGDVQVWYRIERRWGWGCTSVPVVPHHDVVALSHFRSVEWEPYNKLFSAAPSTRCPSGSCHILVPTTSRRLVHRYCLSEDKGSLGSKDGEQNAALRHPCEIRDRRYHSVAGRLPAPVVPATECLWYRKRSFDSERPCHIASMPGRHHSLPPDVPAIDSFAPALRSKNYLGSSHHTSMLSRSEQAQYYQQAILAALRQLTERETKQRAFQTKWTATPDLSALWSFVAPCCDNGCGKVQRRSCRSAVQSKVQYSITKVQYFQTSKLPWKNSLPLVPLERQYLIHHPCQDGEANFATISFLEVVRYYGSNLLQCSGLRLQCTSIGNQFATGQWHKRTQHELSQEGTKFASQVCWLP